MRKLRRLGACPFEDQHMLVGIRKMVLSANDVADAEVDVIRARRKMIRRHAVGAQQRKVFDVVSGFDLLAIDGIVEADLLIQYRVERGSAAQKSLPRRRGDRFPPAKVRACRD